MKFLIFQDPDWDYSTYDFSTFQSDVAWVSSTLDATDPNLDAFRKRGGKLLMYNGWRDMALTPLGTIEYYEKVVERDASAADDVRLIMVPGMDHCFGGPGPSFVDWLDQIDRWVKMRTGSGPGDRVLDRRADAARRFPTRLRISERGRVRRSRRPARCL